MNMMKILKLFMLTVFVSATALLQSASATQLQVFPTFEGEVVGVTDDGIMIIQRTDIANPREIMRVRQWGYIVKPTSLAAIVQGRKIHCAEMYIVEDVIGGDCSISFVSENSPIPDQLSDQTDIFRSGHLIDILMRMGVGEYGCSALDIANISTYRERCPE